MSDSKMELALRTRRQVLGADVAEKTLGKGAVSAPLHELVTLYGWGEAWQGEHLSLKTRSMLMVVMLAALNRPKQLRLHVQGAINNGANRGEIIEALKHVAVVCGAPCALDAGAIADEVFAQRGPA